MYSIVNSLRCKSISYSITMTSRNVFQKPEQLQKLFNGKRFNSTDREEIYRRLKKYRPMTEGRYKILDHSGYLLLIVPISTFILGTWQVKRRKEKLQLIADMENRLKRPPIPLPEK